MPYIDESGLPRTPPRAGQGIIPAAMPATGPQASQRRRQASSLVRTISLRDYRPPAKLLDRVFRDGRETDNGVRGTQ